MLSTFSPPWPSLQPAVVPAWNVSTCPAVTANSDGESIVANAAIDATQNARKTIIELQNDEDWRIGPIRQGDAQFHSCGRPGPVPAPQANGDYTTIVLM